MGAMMMLWLGLAGAADDQALPVDRIRFYETGVAWFERAGTVAGRRAHLPLPTAHLDDVLKSLVVLDGDARLDALTYPSAPGTDAARADAGLDPEAGERIGYDAALHALRGLQVVVERSKGDLRGVLLDVEGPLPGIQRAPDDPTPLAVQAPTYVVTVVGDDGGLHRLLTSEITALRAADRDATERLRIAAESLVANRAQRTRAVGLQVDRPGRIAVGYLAEAPVWRVSYRLHEPGPDARLEGWALIHNTTSEPWEGVRIELANGEPDSFLFPLTAPRYADRELVVPERPLATVAQLATTTPDDLWHVDRGGSMGMGMTGYGMGGGGSAYGVGVGRGHAVIAGGQGEAAPPAIETPSQFVYVAPRPVDLPAHHSAAVPILRAALEVEEVVLADGSQVRNAVWLRNTTQQTLPAGVVSVIQAHGLAGEAQLPRLKPTETEMVPFATERDVLVTKWVDVGRTRADSLRWVETSERLQIRRKRTESWNLEVRNRKASPVTVWMPAHFPKDAELPEGLRYESDDRTGDAYLVWQAEPGSHEQVASISVPETQQLAVEQITVAMWEEMREDGLVDRRLADDLIGWSEDLAALEARRDANGAEVQRLQTELTGVRDSLRVAETDAAPLTRRASALEQQLTRLRAEQGTIQQDREALLVRMKERLADLQGPQAVR